jgi:hypothetical protein
MGNSRLYTRVIHQYIARFFDNETTPWNDNGVRTTKERTVLLLPKENQRLTFLLERLPKLPPTTESTTLPYKDELSTLSLSTRRDRVAPPVPILPAGAGGADTARAENPTLPVKLELPNKNPPVPILPGGAGTGGAPLVVVVLLVGLPNTNPLVPIPLLVKVAADTVHTVGGGAAAAAAVRSVPLPP